MFLLGKICVSVCVAKLLAKCLFSVLRINPCQKNDISRYIFIQTLKCSLLDKKIVYQSFNGVPLNFYFKENFLCSAVTSGVMKTQDLRPWTFNFFYKKKKELHFFEITLPNTKY